MARTIGDHRMYKALLSIAAGINVGSALGMLSAVASKWICNGGTLSPLRRFDHTNTIFSVAMCLNWCCCLLIYLVLRKLAIRAPEISAFCGIAQFTSVVTAGWLLYLLKGNVVGTVGVMILPLLLSCVASAKMLSLTGTGAMPVQISRPPSLNLALLVACTVANFGLARWAIAFVDPLWPAPIRLGGIEPAYARIAGIVNHEMTPGNIHMGYGVARAWPLDADGSAQWWLVWTSPRYTRGNGLAGQLILARSGLGVHAEHATYINPLVLADVYSPEEIVAADGALDSRIVTRFRQLIPWARENEQTPPAVVRVGVRVDPNEVGGK